MVDDSPGPLQFNESSVVNSEEIHVSSYGTLTPVNTTKKSGRKKSSVNAKASPSSGFQEKFTDFVRSSSSSTALRVSSIHILI